MSLSSVYKMTVGKGTCAHKKYYNNVPVHSIIKNLLKKMVINKKLSKSMQVCNPPRDRCKWTRILSSKCKGHQGTVQQENIPHNIKLLKIFI